MVQRLAGHAGGEVGDQAEPEHLQAGLAGGDRLQGGAHPDQVPAHRPHHADLGRRLVVRAGELRVDALVEAGLDLVAQRPQPGGVQVGEVDEGRAGQRGGGGQVEVVADEHRSARRPALLQPAAAVGEHDGATARRRRGAHAVHDGCHPEALVEVGAAEEHEQPAVAGADRADLAGVALDGGRCEAREVGGRDLRLGLAQQVDGGQPPAAEDEGDVMGGDAGGVGERRGGVGGEGVR